MSAKFLKHLFPVLFALFICFNSLAQKLPSMQLNSKLAKTKIKVDGKLNEWQLPFEAFNGSTELFYTIANDADNLYLAIKPKDMVIAKKIIGGGITVAFNNTGKKDIGRVSVTYPIIPASSMPRLGNLLNETAVGTDSVTKIKQTDSLKRLLNSEFNKIAKEIKVIGVSDIPDFMISVYSDTGIKAAAYFDDKHVLTYEMVIPLKYLYNAIASQGAFYYQVKLNGLDSVIKPIVHNTPEGPVTVRGIPRGFTNGGESSFNVLSYATDFWGYYTLAK